MEADLADLSSFPLKKYFHKYLGNNIFYERRGRRRSGSQLIFSWGCPPNPQLILLMA